MRARILGPVEVWDGTVWRSLGTAKHRALFAILVAGRGRPVPVDRLVEELWEGAPPGTAVNLIQQYVGKLRRVLGDRGGDLLRTQQPGYQLVRADDDLDAGCFEALVTRGTDALGAGNSRLAAELLGEGLALWRGQPFADVVLSGSVAVEASRLEQLRLAALEARIDADLALARHTTLVPELQALVDDCPLRERFWGQLMLALFRSGRQAEALDSYGRVRAVLVEELGVEPGAELQRLHEAILRADPELQCAVPSRPMSVPWQLPSDISSFVGRQKDLAALDDLTGARTGFLALIHGMPGVGKTALAVRWGHYAHDRFPDGQLYVDLRGFDQSRPPADPHEALGGFLRALGVDPRQLPRDVEERAGLFRSVTAARRMLVVLDNAATAEQVRPLMPGGASCLVLVTSRSQLTGLVAVDGAENLAVDVLGADEAMTLLESVLGRPRVASERGEAADLSALCGYLPLALRVVAGKLVLRPRQKLATTATDLRTGHLAGLDVESDQRAAVRAAFDTSYYALEPADQLVLRRLGLIPGPDFSPSLAAALSDQPDDDTMRRLDRLMTLHLVEPGYAGRYRFHDLVRLYAREQCAAEESADSKGGAVVRLYDWYLATTQNAAQMLYPHHQLLSEVRTAGSSFSSRTSAWAWFEAERANLVAAVEDAASREMSTVTWRLVDALRSLFLPRTYYYDDWQVLARTGLRAAEQTGDDQARAAMHLSLGLAQWGLGDNHGYLEHSAQALDFARRAGWTKVIAKALTNLAHAHVELGDPQRALEFVAQAIRLKRAAGASADLAHSLIISASAHASLGNVQDCLGGFQEALTLAKQEGSIPEQTHAWYGLGRAYRHLGQLAEASKCLAAGLASARKQEHTDREATILGVLAEIACDTGQRTQAHDLIQQARTIARDSGYRQTEVKVLNAAGRISSALGQPQAAIAHHQHALEIAQEISCHYDQVDALLGLADAHYRLGNRHDALALAERSLTRSQTAGYRIQASRALAILAEVEPAHYGRNNGW